MKIENKNGLKILTPEADCVLYSVITDEYHEKVFLGVNDSVDNYREVKKEILEKEENKKVEQLEEVIKQQDAAISNLAEQLAALAVLVNDKKED